MESRRPTCVCWSLRELSGGQRVSREPDRAALDVRRRPACTIEHELPGLHARAGDAGDLAALAIAVPCCDPVTCDAFMADVGPRARLQGDVWVSRRSGLCTDSFAAS
jgi:hypothetical protein